MLSAGLVLVVFAVGVAALDFFGVTPGAGGIVTLTLVVSMLLMLGGGIRSSLRDRHPRHAHH